MVPLDRRHADLLALLVILAELFPLKPFEERRLARCAVAPGVGKKVMSVYLVEVKTIFLCNKINFLKVKCAKAGLIRPKTWKGVALDGLQDLRRSHCVHSLHCHFLPANFLHHAILVHTLQYKIER